MSPKPKMELTWTKDETLPGWRPSVRFEFADDPARAESPVRTQEAALSVCGVPRCGCLNILFTWLHAPLEAGAAATAPLLPFWFDLNKKAVVTSTNRPATPEAMRLAEIIRAELTEADQQKLRAWYLARKLFLIESTPGDKIDLRNLPDATGGLMIGFVEVFPCGLALNFNLNDEAWVVDEQYCVQPGCNCRETVLSFFKLRDAAGNLHTGLKDPPAFYYNYDTGVTRPFHRGAAGNPAATDLLAAVTLEHPDLNAQLHLRHLIMQGLYLRQEIQQRQARRTALEALNASPRAALPKIGRNDPCPCGSGLKYKRCCLNQSAENRANWKG